MVKFTRLLLGCLILTLTGCRSQLDQATAASKASTPSSSQVASPSSTKPSSATDKQALQIDSSSSTSTESLTEPASSVAQETTPTPSSEATQPSKAIWTGHRVMLPIRPQLQEVWNYCAPTTVSMILSARGIAVDQYQLAKEMGTYEPWGTHNRDAIRILNRHLFGYETPGQGQAGYRLATVTNAGPEEVALFKERLRQNITDGYPMYYTFDVAKLYPGLKGEHNVIGIGYELTSDGQDIANVYYLDPSPNVQDPTYGGLKKVSPQELLNAMLTCVEPNYGW